MTEKSRKKEKCLKSKLWKKQRQNGKLNAMKSIKF